MTVHADADAGRPACRAAGGWGAPARAQVGRVAVASNVGSSMVWHMPTVVVARRSTSSSARSGRGETNRWRSCRVKRKSMNCGGAPMSWPLEDGGRRRPRSSTRLLHALGVGWRRPASWRSAASWRPNACITRPCPIGRSAGDQQQLGYSLRDNPAYRDWLIPKLPAGRCAAVAWYGSR